MKYALPVIILVINQLYFVDENYYNEALNENFIWLIFQSDRLP